MKKNTVLIKSRYFFYTQIMLGFCSLDKNIRLLLDELTTITETFTSIGKHQEQHIIKESLCDFPDFMDDKFACSCAKLQC